MEIAGKQRISTKDASPGDMDNDILTLGSRVVVDDSTVQLWLGPAI
jgi:hypothetical protein